MISEKGEQLKILRTIHEQGHLGRDKVHSQVGARYYWKTLYSDVVDLVSYVPWHMGICTLCVTNMYVYEVTIYAYNVM